MGRQQGVKASAIGAKSKGPCASVCCCCCCCCCGAAASASSRPSVSSAASSEDIVSSGTEPLQTVSSLAHAVVQERLSRLIDEERRRPFHGGWRREGRVRMEDGKVIVLMAMDKETYDPRRDFMMSMMDVITSKGLEDPKELRSLLNCYINMNPREQRQSILEAFHEVCSLLFPSGGR